MLKDYGVAYTTFETSDRIGGNWAFGNPNGHSSAYRSLHIDTSHDLRTREIPAGRKRAEQRPRPPRLASV